MPVSIEYLGVDTLALQDDEIHAVWGHRAQILIEQSRRIDELEEAIAKRDAELLLQRGMLDSISKRLEAIEVNTLPMHKLARRIRMGCDLIAEAAEDITSLDE